MNREIEFRARHIKDKFWLEHFRISNCGSCIYAYGERYNRDEVELMQYTDLKDKNGKKIFEGDIVGMPYEHDDEEGFTGKPRAVVEWNKGGFTVKCFNGNRFDLFAEEGRLEVFGNIYENPELLAEINNN